MQSAQDLPSNITVTRARMRELVTNLREVAVVAKLDKAADFATELEAQASQSHIEIYSNNLPADVGVVKFRDDANQGLGYVSYEVDDMKP